MDDKYGREHPEGPGMFAARKQYPPTCDAWKVMGTQRKTLPLPPWVHSLSATQDSQTPRLNRSVVVHVRVAGLHALPPQSTPSVAT